jgi:hypothetical protein
MFVFVRVILGGLESAVHKKLTLQLYKETKNTKNENK